MEHLYSPLFILQPIVAFIHIYLLGDLLMIIWRPGVASFLIVDVGQVGVPLLA